MPAFRFGGRNFWPSNEMAVRLVCHVTWEVCDMWATCTCISEIVVCRGRAAASGTDSCSSCLLYSCIQSMLLMQASVICETKLLGDSELGQHPTQAEETFLSGRDVFMSLPNGSENARNVVQTDLGRKDCVDVPQKDIRCERTQCTPCTHRMLTDYGALSLCLICARAESKMCKMEPPSPKTMAGP